jgi:hypothetical protein
MANGLALLQGDEMSHCDILPSKSVLKRKFRADNESVHLETECHVRCSGTENVAAGGRLVRVEMSLGRCTGGRLVNSPSGWYVDKIATSGWCSTKTNFVLLPSP